MVGHLALLDRGLREIFVVRAALLCGVGLRILAELPGLLPISRSRSTESGERVGAYLRAAKLAFLGWR